MEFTISYAGGYSWNASAYDKTHTNRLSIENIYRKPSERYLCLSINFDKIAINFDVTQHYPKLKDLKVKQTIKLVKRDNAFKLFVENDELDIGQPKVTAALVWHSSPYDGDLVPCYTDWLSRHGM